MEGTLKKPRRDPVRDPVSFQPGSSSHTPEREELFVRARGGSWFQGEYFPGTAGHLQI